MVMQSMDPWNTVKHEVYVEQGIQKYENSSIEEKLAIQKKMGQYKGKGDHYDAYIKAIREHQPITFCAIGTSGLNNDGKDEIVQICITSYTYDDKDKIYKLDKDNSRYSICAVGADNLTKMINSIGADLKTDARGRQGYDLFKSGGFGKNINENGVGMTAQEYTDYCKAMDANTVQAEKQKLTEMVNKAFTRVNENNGIYVGLNNPFAQKFFDTYQITMPDNKIDILDIIKEHDERGLDGILNRENTRYALDAIINQYKGHSYNNDDGKLYSAQNTVNAMYGILFDIIPYVKELSLKEANQPVEKNKKPDMSMFQTADDMERLTFYKLYDENMKDTKQTENNLNITCYTSTEKADNTQNQTPLGFNEFSFGKQNNENTATLNGFEQAMGVQPTITTPEQPKSEGGVNNYKEQHPEEVKEVMERSAYLEDILNKVVSVFTEMMETNKQQQATMQAMADRLAAIEGALAKKPTKRTTKKDKEVKAEVKETPETVEPKKEDDDYER